MAWVGLASKTSLVGQVGQVVTADQVTRLWELAVAWPGNPALGLERELALRHVNFDVVGYAMLFSPDLHAGLDSLSRYRR